MVKEPLHGSNDLRRFRAAREHMNDHRAGDVGLAGHAVVSDPSALQLGFQSCDDLTAHGEFTFYGFSVPLSTDFSEGGSLPRKGPERQTERVAVEDAERWCGVDVIRAAGTSDRGHASSYSGWKTGDPRRGILPGVPWSVVGPPIKGRVDALLSGRSQDGTKLAPDATSPAPLSPDEVALMADATGHDAFRKLATIFKNRHRDPETWEAITRNLRVFARAADRAAPTRRRAVKARRER